jgi:hypothetical protein
MTGIEGAGLRYEDFRIAVRQAPAAHLRWLREFLTPAFESGPPEVGEWCVEVDEDQARYAALMRQGRCPGAVPVACFALDHDFIHLPSWSGPSGTHTVVDEESRAAYEVDRRQRSVRLIAAPRQRAVRKALMRVVRELAMDHVQRRGDLLLHAAALTVGGRGVVIAGPKDAGKTTLLIQLLRHGAARYVSNDRVVVSLADTHPRVRGMPTIISIRAGTLQLFPELCRRLTASTFHYRLTLDEAARGECGPARAWGDGRFGVSPAQFCALLGVEPLASARVSALVFPRIAPDERAMTVRKLSVSEAAERLGQSVFGANPIAGAERLLAVSDDAPAAEPAVRAAGIARLAAAVPAFECRLGPDAYGSARDAATIAERLVA